MSALNAPIRYFTETRFGERTRHRIVRFHGFEGYWVRWTDHCSGCTEVGDYGTVYGPFGCEECGYTGKRRNRMFVPLGPLELVGELRHDQAPWGGKIIVWHPSVNLANIQGEQDAVVSGH